MPFSEQEIQANRDYFARKLRAERQRADVVSGIEKGRFDFALLDVRGRAPFAAGHITGAVCVPLDEIEQAAPSLPKDRPLVTYCWGHD